MTRQSSLRPPVAVSLRILPRFRRPLILRSARFAVPALLVLTILGTGFDLRPRPARADNLATLDRWGPLPEAGPGQRRGASWIHDAQRNTLVYFGGQSPPSDNPTNETWLFDLTTRCWQQAPTTGGGVPLARYRHTAVLDAGHDRMIVFGGIGPAGNDNTVWSLDLGTFAWSLLATTGSIPAPRAMHNAVYDPPRHRMIVFGGGPGGATSDSLWALDLDGLSWSLLGPFSPSPEPRRGASAVYSILGDKLVLFGGNGQTSGPLNDVWTFSLSGNVWTHLTPSGTAPAARLDAAAAYDSTTTRMFVYGGSSGASTFGDISTLTLSGTPTWSQLTFAGTQPPARSQHAAPPKVIGGRWVIYGGRNSAGAYLGDAEVLNFASLAWETVPDSGSEPSLRMACQAIDDSTHDRMILFGGWTGVGSFFNDSYELRYGPVGAPALTWAPLATTGSVPTRYGAGHVYDPVGHRMITIAGSRADSGYTNDVWALDVNTLAWSEIHPTGTLPPDRTGEATVYDALHQRIVMFGGRGRMAVSLNDTWILDLTYPTPQWFRVDTDSSAVRPPRRLRMAHSDDPERNRMIITCGVESLKTVHDPTTNMFNDTWAFDYSTLTWSQLATTNDPWPRFDVHAFVVADQNRLYMFGGALEQQNVDSNELWYLDLDTNQWTLQEVPGLPPGPRNGYTMVWNEARRWLIPYGGTDGNALLQDGGIFYQSPAPPEVTGIGQPPRRPAAPGGSASLALRQNGGSVDITAASSQGGTAAIEIFSATGRRIARMTAALAAGAPTTLRWNARDGRGARVPTGLYFARLTAPGGSAQGKFALLQ